MLTSFQFIPYFNGKALVKGGRAVLLHRSDLQFVPNGAAAESVEGEEVDGAAKFIESVSGFLGVLTQTGQAMFAVPVS